MIIFKSFTNMLLVLFVAVLLGCVNTPESVISPATVGQKDREKVRGRSPILETWMEKDGSVPIRGKSLHFRLFDDGHFEFDYEIGKGVYEDGVRKRVQFHIRRIPLTQLSEEEFSEFRIALVDLKSSMVEHQEFERVGKIFDTTAKLTIIIKRNGVIERELVINDSDDVVMKKSDQSLFPDSVTKLIELIHLKRSSLGDAKKE